MQKTLLFLFIGLSFTLLFTSCSKDESEEKKSVSTSELILGSWLEVGYLKTDGEEFFYEDYEEYDDRCNRYYNFYSQGRLEITSDAAQGNMYCGSFITSYTVLDENHIELNLESSSGEYTTIATILELTENKMILEWLKNGSFKMNRIFTRK